MSANNPVRLMPFKFSTSTCFVLEFGNEYIRFYSNRAQVLDDDGDPLELTSPYTAATGVALKATEVFQLQFSQIEDVIYITHPSHPVYSLTRVSDTSWTLAKVQWLAADGSQRFPPLLDQNLTTTTITPNATSGTVSLLSSADIFNSKHVGSYWQIAHIRPSQLVNWDPNTLGNGSSDPIHVKGAWNFQTSGSWSARVVVERSKGGSDPYHKVLEVVSNNTANYNIPGTSEDDEYYRITISGVTEYPATQAELILSCGDAVIYGLVQITAVTDATHATATALINMDSTEATVYWSEGAFSDYRGYPATVVTHQQRLWFAGTTFQPQRVWSSMTGDLENFDRTNTALATSSIAIDLAADKKGPIYWLASGVDLFAGLAGAEWTISAPNSTQAMTTANIQAKQQSENGSEQFVPALPIGDALVYCERRGVKLSQIMFSIATEKYMSQELTVLANHILKPGVVQMDVQNQFDAQKIVWCVTTDGRLCGLTYDLDQKVIAWHQHNTRPASGDMFLSVACVYGPDGSDCDDVYVAVQRDINGTGTIFIELLSTLDWEESDGDPNEAVYCDCTTVFKNPDLSTNTLTGLDALEGQQVVVVANNMVVGRYTVSSGSITIPALPSATEMIVLVGLDYETDIQPISLDTQPVVQSLSKVVKSVSPWLYKSLGGLLSNGNAAQDVAIVERQNSDDLNSAPPLYTGIREISFPGKDAIQPVLIIKQVDPLPLTVLSLNINLDVTGRP